MAGRGGGVEGGTGLDFITRTLTPGSPARIFYELIQNSLITELSSMVRLMILAMRRCGTAGDGGRQINQLC